MGSSTSCLLLLDTKDCDWVASGLMGEGTVPADGREGGGATCTLRVIRRATFAAVLWIDAGSCGTDA